MASGITIGMMYSRAKRVNPNLTLREFVDYLNEAIETEFPELLGKTQFTKITVQDGRRYYPFPESVDVIKVVYYKDSEDNYRIIKRITSAPVEAPDIT